MNYIYLVRNSITNEPYYVGQTTNLQARANDHFKNQSFINPEVICLKETDDKDVADFFEAHFTLLYKTYKISSEHTYNVKIGTFQRAQIFNDNVEQYKVDGELKNRIRDLKKEISELKLKCVRFNKIKEENHKLKMDNRKLLKETESIKIEYDHYKRYYFKVKQHY